MGVCDTLHVLDFGTIIAQGTPAEIRANPLVQQAYLGYAEDPHASGGAHAAAASDLEDTRVLS
jgi:branched-chain amino acid transport system ATP-binding protein